MNNIKRFKEMNKDSPLTLEPLTFTQIDKHTQDQLKTTLKTYFTVFDTLTEGVSIQQKP